MQSNEALAAFRTYASEKMEQNLAQVMRCAAILNVDQMWRRENERCNAVGNLILHLTGNIRQWAVSGLGGEKTERDRPAEFSRREPLEHSRLVPHFEHTVRRAIDIVRELSDEKLAREVNIQGYAIRSIVAVFHIVEHLSFHTGQIVHITKSILNVDLSLYDSQGQRLDANRGRP
ncbi:MAG: DUF1572 family protein [Phycisphaerales bacterium]|nr:DUF1572 family protein [Phycisphaerales bacterium]